MGSTLRVPRVRCTIKKPHMHTRTSCCCCCCCCCSEVPAIPSRQAARSVCSMHTQRHAHSRRAASAPLATLALVDGRDAAADAAAVALADR